MSFTATIMTRDKNNAWYMERPTEKQLTRSARDLLVKYSNIPEEKVEDHVVQIHDEAWEIFPYPCIGQFRFLDLSLKQRDEYPELLEDLHAGKRFLDLGQDVLWHIEESTYTKCCFGQAIRQLVADGAPSENLYGCDIEDEYVTLGYKLFNDKETLRANFLVADIFDEDSALTKLQGGFDIIHTQSFFHLWDYEGQVKASKAVAALLSPQRGSMIIGRQVGTVNEAKNEETMGKMFLHNVESFEKMWKEVGDEIGVTFQVHAELVSPSGQAKFHEAGMRRVVFTVKRE